MDHKTISPGPIAGHHQTDPRGAHLSRRILCVEPDAEARQKIRATLEFHGFALSMAATAEEALEILRADEVTVVVTEINFEGWDNVDYLEGLKDLCPMGVFVIHTNQPERRTGADRRLGRIFEYVVKSGNLDQLFIHVKRAFAFAQELRRSREWAIESERRIHTQLEWLLWKQHRIQTDQIGYGARALQNIKHAISQGMGAGALVTQLELLEMLIGNTRDALDPGANKLLDQIFQTGNNLREWIDSLERYTRMMNQSFECEDLTADALNACIENAVRDVEHLRAVKDQSVEWEPLRLQIPLQCSRQAIELSLRELLTNAFKYSPAKSTIHLTLFRTGNSASLLIINDILPMGGGTTGIPEACENYVFEAFSRLNNVYDDRFQDEELGMGIGLTMVFNAMVQVGARVLVYEVTDHTRDAAVPIKRVVAEIIMPAAASLAPAASSANHSRHTRTENAERENGKRRKESTPLPRRLLRDEAAQERLLSASSARVSV